MEVDHANTKVTRLEQEKNALDDNLASAVAGLDIGEESDEEVKNI